MSFAVLDPAKSIAVVGITALLMVFYSYVKLKRIIILLQRNVTSLANRLRVQLAPTMHQAPPIPRGPRPHGRVHVRRFRPLQQQLQNRLAAEDNVSYVKRVTDYISEMHIKSSYQV